MVGFLYGCLHYSLKKDPRKQIAQLLGNDIDPRLMVGDLNENFNLDEKRSPHVGSSIRYEKFNKFIQDNSLVDVGFQSNKFTWYNKRKVENTILVKLDQALANYKWLSIYLDAILVHLSIIGLDHA